jgi:PKHD-type hydroxylase
MRKLQYEFGAYTGVQSKLQTWAWWEDAFTNEELDILQQMAKKSSDVAAVGNNIVIPEIRRTNLGWVNYEENKRWLFERLDIIVNTVNTNFFNFQLDGFGEPLQLANYTEQDLGHYDWHADSGPGATIRKLSMVMQLSDPNEYTGGDLQLMLGGNELSVKRKRGFMAFFPSWTVHRVTPVLSGSRQSIVTWITGPDFH